ncbi:MULTISPECIES: hypothetical protein [Clostridium]|uniref:DUF3168 domain-containing protein n=1 Tax=Clostridium frigoriphilum TaxID=443253 RepID=A0ABU7UHM8_9CLOT|nr:hypothetical protein [Clostridium sp. DSM 17811]MBU3098384.1 hypothetical protein [Clostridium sp. DSM 17811]
MMLELYEILSNIIEPICPCFVDHYPTTLDKVYPYVEISFPNVTPNNSFSDNNLLEVSIWHNLDTDIMAIETITDTIHKLLNKTHYLTSNMHVSINRETPHRIVLNDEMIGIQRRKLRYKVTIYKI